MRKLPPIMSARSTTGPAFWVALLLGVACASGRAPSPAPAVARVDPERVRATASQLQAISDELVALARSAPWRGRGSFTPEQHDAIEHLLFQYLAARDALWTWANVPEDAGEAPPEKGSGARGLVAAFASAFGVTYFDSVMILAFQDDPVGIRKLNEAFTRSQIPRQTYDRMHASVTDESRIRALEKAWASFSTALATPDSALAKLVASDRDIAAMVEQTGSRARGVDRNLDRVVRHDVRILPEAHKALARSQVAKRLASLETETGDLLYAGRAHLFKGVSRLKDPRAHLIRFSEAQKRLIYQALQPGDLMISYTAGYMSNVFIPGAFKHAMIYVGTPEERARAGLTAAQLAAVPEGERGRLLDSVGQGAVPTGESADLIEAVAEGVKFSHLGTILDTHVNRFLVLRPRLGGPDRRDALANVFRFLGDGYDFRFDFEDASRQVCTELVYRAYTGKGEIDFALTERVGRATLSADDIVNVYLQPDSEVFDFVLFAEAAPGSSSHAARIWVGAAGEQRLGELMGAASGGDDGQVEGGGVGSGL